MWPSWPAWGHDGVARLRTPELVSDKMRERIEAAVDELGYIPNRAAGRWRPPPPRP